ncbi:MAG: sugar transferase [Cyanobacteriota bacterium]|jgi:lipopolysaccharide/colanic/teichoic acid biosynthesis glycosyltransferase
MLSLGPPSGVQAGNIVALRPAILAPTELIDLQSKRSRFVKRTGDIVFSLSVLTLGAPVFLALALLVKASSRGPIFYVQKRIGRDYRPFGCIKFRTMRKGSDRALQSLLSSSPELQTEFSKDFKLKNDPRITKLGKFLRRSSLDELPQFINVLRGEMSVVGPRPIVNDEVNRYGYHMNEVLAVRPGMTGLWQVSGRNNLSYRQRVRLDLRYARTRNFSMDLKIVLQTVMVVLNPRDRGAY